MRVERWSGCQGLQVVENQQRVNCWLRQETLSLGSKQNIKLVFLLLLHPYYMNCELWTELYLNKSLIEILGSGWMTPQTNLTEGDPNHIS